MLNCFGAVCCRLFSSIVFCAQPVLFALAMQSSKQAIGSPHKVFSHMTCWTELIQGRFLRLFYFFRTYLCMMMQQPGLWKLERSISCVTQLLVASKIHGLVRGQLNLPQCFIPYTLSLFYHTYNIKLQGEVSSVFNFSSLILYAFSLLQQLLRITVASPQSVHVYCTSCSGIVVVANFARFD